MSPQDLLADILEQRRIRTDAGLPARVVVLNRQDHDLLQLYRKLLGRPEVDAYEYLTEDTIFDLEICLDGQVDSPRVQ